MPDKERLHAKAKFWHKLTRVLFLAQSCLGKFLICCIHILYVISTILEKLDTLKNSTGKNSGITC